MKDAIILSQISLDDLKTIISETVRKEIQELRVEKPPHEVKYLTRKETAQELGISLPTLHDWTKRGIIPAYRINTRIRYKKEDIEASLNKIQSIKYRVNELQEEKE